MDLLFSCRESASPSVYSICSIKTMIHGAKRLDLKSLMTPV